MSEPPNDYYKSKLNDPSLFSSSEPSVKNEASPPALQSTGQRQPDGAKYLEHDLRGVPGGKSAPYANPNSSTPALFGHHKTSSSVYSNGQIFGSFSSESITPSVSGQEASQINGSMGQLPVYAPSLYAPSNWGSSVYTLSMRPELENNFHDPSSGFANSQVLGAENYQSPYYMPIRSADEPRPLEQLIRRFSVWKMIIKQTLFYLRETAIFKKQTYLGNKAMVNNLEILRKQNSGKLKFKGSMNNASTAAKNLKKSMSTPDLSMSEQQQLYEDMEQRNRKTAETFNENTSLGKFIRKAFLPPGDHSILSLSTTFYNTHLALAERNLVTSNQITTKLVPRLQSLKESLDDTIKQMYTVKGSSDYKTRELKTEIAKTGAILSDYICSVELLTKGETKTSLGTTLKFTSIDPKNDPYLLRLKLDLQLKEQLFTEAHITDAYFDLQYKAVQLESILYRELQNVMGAFSNLINAELDCSKDNLVADLTEGFLRNDPTIDWDCFISNDNMHNLMYVTAKDSLRRDRKIRKKSDVIYPYQNDSISSCVLSGYMEKKSKILKTYSRGFYVLTFNFLHEFKGQDRRKEVNPIASYSLDKISVSASGKDPKKFILHTLTRSDKVKSKFVFRCESVEDTNHWLDCFRKLCSFTTAADRNNSLSEAISQCDKKQAEWAGEKELGTQNNMINAGRLGGVSSPGESVMSDESDVGQSAEPRANDNYHSNHSSGSSMNLSGTRAGNYSSASESTDEKEVSPCNSLKQSEGKNSSAFSMRLPTFQSVKSPPSSEGSTPKETSLRAQLQRHKKAESSSTVSLDMLNEHLREQRASMVKDVRANKSMWPGLATQKLSPAGKARLPSDDLSGAVMSDYFSYAAPSARTQMRTVRGRSRSKSSLNSYSRASSTSRSRSVSPAPIPRISFSSSSSPAGNLPGQMQNLNLKDDGVIQSSTKKPEAFLNPRNRVGRIALPQNEMPADFVLPVTTPGVIPKRSIRDVFQKGNISNNQGMTQAGSSTEPSSPNEWNS
ncbi:hypothetical protein BRETT_000852 [Brettanomyces bruxellensis]|uniref:PH domain-containing protein n=1 Tax=Dekkera bruxellensis TaxID=5007 RepID=A0A871R3P1_DEKBR|nr:uncharacterized protein BRETT_000852 [Brettanomyces bruxellensis]QOU21133.1 hypothetical protein BRETT_000852 [Brettanomyces bruxellensis]